MNFGRRVELARLEKRLTRKELCQQLGISHGCLRDLEILNSTPRGFQELLPKLAYALGKNLNFLITGEQTHDTTLLLKEVDRIIASANQIKGAIT